MDDNSKHVSSYQHDQEILDARGITMTVEEVAGLPTCKYTEKVQSLNLKEDDLMFLKGLRRRIRNRLASQNSRRRSMENLRRLTRELRAVRACRDDALSERRMLLATRTVLRTRYGVLRNHILKVLEERSDSTKVPDLDPEISVESPKSDNYPSHKSQNFECRIDKLVQQSVNHVYKQKDAKTDYKNENDCQIKDYKLEINKKIDKHFSCIRANENYKDSYKNKDSDYKLGDNFTIDRPVDIRSYNYENNYKMENDAERIEKQEWKCKGNDYFDNEINKVRAKTVFIDGVLNLSKKKSHGRKQTAPRRIAYTFSEPNDDGVLDLKIKKEPQ